MKKVCVNIACGSSYIDDWINFDFSPDSVRVKQADLLSPLPLESGVADLVYSSHFIEHIPRDLVPGFLAECYRINRSGGCLRVVLPDWEELCSGYLAARRSGRDEFADFIMLEMLDQCVRRVSGGELATCYLSLSELHEKSKNLIEFVASRTGHDFAVAANPKKINRWAELFLNPQKILQIIKKNYIKAIVSLLPPAFRKQNVSLADVGEKHAWMYDFYTLKTLLIKAGFVNVKRMSPVTSNFPNFPFYPLDVNRDGSPRKGLESMYIEAYKS